MNKAFLKQAQQLQAKLAKAQEELGKETVEASAGGGVVKVVVNGHQKLCSIKISPEAVDPNDVGMLEEVIVIGYGTVKKKDLTGAVARLDAEELLTESLSLILSMRHQMLLSKLEFTIVYLMVLTSQF